MVAAVLGEPDLAALDLETTGLNPRTDRVRLLALHVPNNAGGTGTFLVDCFAVDPSPLWEALAVKELTLHNPAFDLAFLARLGFTPSGQVHDTMLLAQLLAAGTNDRCRLEDCVRRELGWEVDKTHQRSDWSGDLTQDQLVYAALDVEVLPQLRNALTAKIAKAGLERAAEVEQRCLPAVVWMGRQGVAFNRDGWQDLAHAATEEADRLGQELDHTAPPKSGEPHGSWNWDSPQQVKQALALAGCTVESTADETLAAAGHPLADLLRRYRQARKRSSTYGAGWLEHADDDGRVYAHWFQCGAKTGRMSSGKPNLQNIPRNPIYRRCFAAPPGRVLIKADYSQIELRIAAKVTEDRAMLEAYRTGADLHTLTAQRMTGRDEVSKEERQLAKPVNFGLIYGLGVKSLRSKARSEYGLELTEAEAARYRRTFFATYPAVQRWHGRIRGQRAKETRTLTGRRVLVEADGFYGAKANYVIQGTGGDGIKLALALLWERRDQCPGAFPVLAVHDEIVVEADTGQADAAAAWLRTAMVDAMAPLLDPVPVEVEVKIARTWGGV